MRDIVSSLEGEYLRYRKLGLAAIEQLQDPELTQAATGEGNSITTLVWHVSGNFASRFTDFLTSDGEKPWRDRESEFSGRKVTRDELVHKWDAGWDILFAALATLSDADLGSVVKIRGQPLTVREALARSLSHASYHVGQIVFLARSIRGMDWHFLSIPPGQSASFNTNPSMQKAPKVPAGGGLAERIERAVTGPAWHGPALKEVLDGVSAAEAAAHPISGGHSIAELVRHMKAWADIARIRLRQETIVNPSPEEDWPAAQDLDGARWSGLVEELYASYRSLAAEVRQLTVGELSAPVAGQQHSVEDMVRGVVEHAAYHGGQAALIRRALRGPKR